MEYLSSGDECQITVAHGAKGDLHKRIDALASLLFEEEDWMALAWKMYSEGGSSDTILTVLLCSLPNLKSPLFKDGLHPSIFLDSLSRAASKLRDLGVDNTSLRRIPFSQLHSVRAVSDLENGYRSFMALHCSFSLPSICNVEICRANSDWADENDDWSDEDELEAWDVGLRSSSVGRLSFPILR